MNIEPLTGRQARLLLECLDNVKALTDLSDDDYQQFWQAKYFLLAVEVLAELDAREREAA